MDLNTLINLQRGPLTDVVAWLQCQQFLANPLLCSQCNNRYGNETEKWQSCRWLFLVCTLYFVPAVLKKTLLNHYQFVKKHFPIFIDQTRVASRGHCKWQNTLTTISLPFLCSITGEGDPSVTYGYLALL